MLVLSVCNAKKGMRMIDHAILFIFPIFTNLYFNFESDIWTDTTQKSAKLQRRAKARSHSTPNISESANKSSLRKRFSSLIFVSVVVLVHTHQQGHASVGKAPMLGHIISMKLKTIQYHAMQYISFVKSHPHVQNFFTLLCKRYVDENKSHYYPGVLQFQT